MRGPSTCACPPAGEHAVFGRPGPRCLHWWPLSAAVFVRGDSRPSARVGAEGEPRRTVMNVRTNPPACLLVLMALPATTRAGSPGPPDLPVLGVTALQTMRINVTLPPNPVGPCDAVLGFADSNGTLVGPTLTVVLQAGQAAFLAIAGKTLVRGLGQRAQLRPVVTPVDEGGSGADGCVAIAEVFDTATALDRVLSVGVPAVQLPPSPIFGMVGLGKHQTARLSVVATPPNPICEGVLSFADSAGNPVGGSRSVVLSSGQAAFLDLNGNDLVQSLGQRVEVRPVFTQESGSCQTSAEVFEQLTGSTMVQVNPGPPDVQ